MANLTQQGSLATTLPMPVMKHITIFYDVLTSLARHIPKHNVLIIEDNMNVQIGKDENNKFY